MIALAKRPRRADHATALGGEEPRDVGADAPARARDNDHLPVELAHGDAGHSRAFPAPGASESRAHAGAGGWLGTATKGRPKPAGGRCQVEDARGPPPKAGLPHEASVAGEVGVTLAIGVAVGRGDAPLVEALAAERARVVGEVAEESEAKQPQVVGVDLPRAALEPAHRPERAAAHHPAEGDEFLRSRTTRDSGGRARAASSPGRRAVVARLGAEHCSASRPWPASSSTRARRPAAPPGERRARPHRPDRRDRRAAPRGNSPRWSAGAASCSSRSSPTRAACRSTRQRASRAACSAADRRRPIRRRVVGDHDLEVGMVLRRTDSSVSRRKRSELWTGSPTTTLGRGRLRSCPALRARGPAPAGHAVGRVQREAAAPW